jgi:hypothetical protein
MKHMKVYFFTYGHVSPGALKEKFGEINVVGAALLKGYDVHFCRSELPSFEAEVAVLKPDPNVTIIGILLKIESYQLQLLDAIYGLVHTEVTVSSTQSRTPALKERRVYTHMPSSSTREDIQPTAKYYRMFRVVVIQAAELYRRHMKLPPLDLIPCLPIE